MSGDQDNFDKMTRSQLESLLAKGHPRYHVERARIALAKLDQKDGEISSDRRHGQEMLAAAVANRRANQALSVGIGALILAAISIMQQCQG